MTIKYLKNAKNVNDLKKLYIEYLKKLHPDNGGTTEECQQLNNEYEYLRKTLPAGTDPEREQTEAEKKAAASLDKEIRDILNKIIRFQNINIEIVGTWIWIDGATYEIKEELKSAGFVWSKARRKWHCTPYDSPKYYKGKKKSFDALRRMYGSENVETEKQERIA